MEREQEPKRELPSDLVQAYADTFIPRWDKYPVQLPNGRYIQVHKPLTLEHVSSHLEDYQNRELPTTAIGAYALDENNQTKWICFDTDQEDQWDGLFSLAGKLRSDRVPGYLEPSRRGGHLWLFVPRMPGVKARRFGNQLLSEHGLNVELYPKRDRLIEGAGSFVRLPLGVHRKQQWVYHFVDVGGNPLAPSITEQIKILAAPELVRMSFIDEVVARSPEPQPLSGLDPFWWRVDKRHLQDKWSVSNATGRR